MSAVTMDGDFGVKTPVDRNKSSSPVIQVVTEPAKEIKMEKVATLPAGEIGTPFAEKLANFGRAVLPPVLGMLILLVSGISPR